MAPSPVGVRMSLLSSRPPSQFTSLPPCSYGGGSFSFSNLIQAVTRRFSTEYELQQVRSHSPALGSAYFLRRPKGTAFFPDCGPEGAQAPRRQAFLIYRGSRVARLWKC